MSGRYAESLVTLGEAGELVGILSEPLPGTSNARAQQSVALIIVNAGMLHRTGPCRSSVYLARQAAKHGFLAFRLDYSGIGDSRFSNLADDSDQANSAELKLTMDYLQQHFGIDRFVIHGLCSGSRDAFSCALSDQRVIGISQIDGFTYPTRRFYLSKIKEKLASPVVFFAFLGRLFKRLFIRSNVALQQDQDMTIRDWTAYPSREKVQQGYADLVARNIKLLVVYTGSWDGEYRYDDQFYDMYPAVDFTEKITLKCMREADHIMTNPQHAREFNDLLLKFLDSLKS